MRKILYSPGYGAGWTTWNSSNPGIRKKLLEYKPIIDYLESGGKFNIDECEVRWDKNKEVDDSNLHPLLKKLRDECLEEFGDKGYIYMGGATDLKVVEVHGRVRINEYDGYESIEEEGEYEGWI